MEATGAKKTVREKQKAYILQWVRMGIPLSKALKKLGLTEEDFSTFCTMEEVQGQSAEFTTEMVERAYLGALKSPSLAMNYIRQADPELFLSEGISSFSNMLTSILEKIDNKLPESQGSKEIS